MRARHRHFNPRHAGADLVLDARYINQADNTAVSTWADRSGNGYDASQATGAYQPTFRTAQQGGSPVVRFSGGQGLEATIGNKNNFSFFLTHIRTTASTVEKRYAAVNATTNQSQSDSIGLNNTFSGGYLSVVKDGVAWGAQTGNYLNNVWTNALATHDGSVMRLYVNGNIATIASNSRNPSTGSRVSLGSVFAQGGAPLAPADADIASVRSFASVIAQPLRKRLEHAAAYSFKISCN